jgi:MerR family transcriptional regulator, copper efflux regulator
MSSYTIGEVADRSGFSTSSLRYYEGIGLVAPATRTESGYRVYDDQTLARLAFIARAKQLGCSLAEITDLVAIWDGERCGPVQRRFHELVTGKLQSAQHHIAELVAFTRELRAVAAQLSGEPIDGPCGDDCACITAAASVSAEPVTGALTPPDEPVIACTLEPDAMPDRLMNWHDLLAHARQRTTGSDGALRVEFDDALRLDELTQLVTAEQRCCAFFSFAITIDARGVALEVRAPDRATDIVAALFGQPS